MAWANQYLDMHHMGTMVLCIGSSVGCVIYDYVPGYFYEKYGPESFLYIEMVCGILFMIIVILMSLFVWLRPIRPEFEEPKTSIVEVPMLENDSAFRQKEAT